MRVATAQLVNWYTNGHLFKQNKIEKNASVKIRKHVSSLVFSNITKAELTEPPIHVRWYQIITSLRFTLVLVNSSQLTWMGRQ